MPRKPPDPPESLYHKVQSRFRYFRGGYYVHLIVISVILLSWRFVAPAGLGFIVLPAAGVLFVTHFYQLAMLDWIKLLARRNDDLKPLRAIPIRRGEHLGVMIITEGSPEALRARHVLNRGVLVLLQYALLFAGGCSLMIPLFDILLGLGRLDKQNATFMVGGCIMIGGSLIPATLGWTIGRADDFDGLTIHHRRWTGSRRTTQIDRARFRSIRVDDGKCFLVYDMDGRERKMCLAHLFHKEPWSLDRLASELAARFNLPRTDPITFAQQWKAAGERNRERAKRAAPREAADTE